MELDKLVKQYQGGDTSTLEAIKAHIWPREGGAVIRNICGKVAPGYLPGADSVTIEPFIFNEDDLQRVFNNSLNYALKTYIPGKGKKFGSWFYDVFNGRLYNLKGEYIKQQADGEKIKTAEEFQREVKAIIGDVYNPQILKECKYITDDALNQMSDRQLKFIGMIIALYDNNKNITDVLAAEILGVTEKTIQNYQNELQAILADSNEKCKAGRADDLPELLNEFGIKDPTPRQAAKNIYKAIY